MSNSYLKFLGLPTLFGTERTKEILIVNPTAASSRVDAESSSLLIYDYDEDHLNESRSERIEDCLNYKNSKRVTWINIDGIRKAEVELVCNHYGVHSLLVEDILSMGQRPKMDEVENVVFCLLNMLYFNEENKTVETEQISIVLGADFLLSFQEDSSRDVFDPIRVKIHMPKSQIRMRKSDYLCYAMLDMIVDNYFVVMEKLGEQIELLEEEVIRRSSTRALAKINQLRKELIVLKRNTGPVRDLVNNMVRSESDLLEDRTMKYFKDVSDHINQAYDLAENYRDMMVGLQDLYINNVNLKMNEVMKVMAIVTCLLAPATVIGGIFGMNFDIIPYAHQHWGFYFAVTMMLLIPLWMLWAFRKRGWF